jgi:quinolinate synthase
LTTTRQRDFSQRCELLFRKGFVDNHNEKNTQCIETKNEKFPHAAIIVHDNIHALTMLGVVENQFDYNHANEFYFSKQ